MRSRDLSCVHCLDPATTDDHLIPDSWYPDSTPANQERWTVPSCRSCNTKYGRLEQDLLFPLALGMDPGDPRSQGLSDRVLRSMNPAAGVGDRDIRHRRARLRKFGSRVRTTADPPSEGVLLGFGIQPDSVYSEFSALPFPHESFRLFVRKVAKGLTYLCEKRVVTDGHRIKFTYYEGDGWPAVNEMIDRYGVVLDRGPGIVLRRASVPGQPIQSIARVELWGRLRWITTILPADREEVLAQATWFAA